jgi:hypothetical protein
VACQDQRDAEKPREVPRTPQQPEAGSRGLRAAKPNGAQRCPP